MEKTLKKPKEKFEKPTKLEKKPCEILENTNEISLLRELRSKNVALNFELSKSQVFIGELQGKIAKISKENSKENSKEKEKFEEISYLNKQITQDFSKEKQRNKVLEENTQELQKKIQRISEENSFVRRKVLLLIRKTKDFSNLKGKFFEKVDFAKNYKEILEKIEAFFAKNFSEEFEKFNEEFKENPLNENYSHFFDAIQKENDCYREKLFELSHKMQEKKGVFEKLKEDFLAKNQEILRKNEDILKENEEIHKENEVILKENQLLKERIDAFERKCENQQEIIEILKVKIRGFEENSNEIDENVEEFEGKFEDNLGNVGLEEEIEDLDQEILYIHGLLNVK